MGSPTTRISGQRFRGATAIHAESAVSIAQVNVTPRIFVSMGTSPSMQPRECARRPDEKVMEVV